MTDQLPAHLAQRQRPSMAQDAVAGLQRSRGPHVSIADNRFTLVDGNGAEKPIQTLYVDIVVIDVNPHVSRLYYDPSKPYNKDENTPPLCFSDNGIGASAQASEPQNNNCQICPKSAWNSAVSKMTGKGIPACAQRKKLAVIAGGMGEMVFDLTVPPASLGNWLAYVNILVQRGLEPYDVYTRVEFESQGVLKFSPAPIGDKGLCYVHEVVVALTEKLWAAKATEIATNKNDAPWGGQADVNKIAYAAQAGGQTTGIAPDRGMVSAPAPQPMAPPPQPFGQQTANPGTPFGSAGTQAGSASFGGAPPADPFAQPSTSSQTAATLAKRGRGPNKPKEAPPPPADDGIPPFLRREGSQPANQDATGHALGFGDILGLPVPPAPNPTQFGMQQNPPAPDAGIKEALDAAFRLPT